MLAHLVSIAIILCFGVIQGSAQQSHQHAQASKGTINQMSMSPFDMIKNRITPAQRKAAAANAAKRRATEAIQRRQQQEVPVGPPGSGGALPAKDQLYFGTYPNYANSPLPQVTIDPLTGAVTGVVPNTGIRKFVDTLPGLTAAGANDLGQYIPIANPDTTTFPGSDYYEISVSQFTTEKMHADLPPTTLRGYVQTNNGTDATGNNTIAPAPYHYLGPLIIAQQNRPVRIKFTNNLPAGAGGNLFIPVDQTVMGAGNGLASGQSPYLQNRATLHLHGGNTPWISDGTPHQWTVPALDFASTAYPRGDSTQFVPDMFFVNGAVVPQCTAARTTNCSPAVLPATTPPLPVGAANDPGPGSMTFFYTNQQSARLMFYHDHAYGITRLNVYAGEAAGYLLLDPTDLAWMGNGTVPPLADTIPLVIQDKTFVPPNPASAPVYSVGILANGSGYNAATTTVAFAGGTCTTMPTAIATVGNMLDPFGKLVTNAVTGITLTNGGSCSVPPTVAIADTGTIPGTGAAAFASLATLGAQDPTWDPALWGGPGNFWFPHFYMTNQWPDNPDGSGVNPMGRWDYAQWFWPPFGNGTYRERGPIACGTPALPSGCPGFPTPIDPAPATDMMGGGSTVSLTPEAFMDTPVVNGTAYPTVTLQPKAYRLRVLSAGNDRTLNLSWFIACGTGGYTPALNATCPAPPPGFTGPAGTEVGMVPAAPTAGWPVQWPTDGRDGGVPDPAGMGPSWIQIGTEGGFLPNPVVIPPTPVGYEYFRRSITVLNISSHGLLLMPAERADVIVDFSAFAGKTLILYNDAPTPVPAFDPRYDYYTGDPDQTGMGGAPSTLAGYGPNTRTIMRVVVAGTPVPFNAVPLNTALPAAFKLTQPVPVVPEAAYNTAYGQTFPNTYAKIADTSMTFTPIGGTAAVKVNTENKAIQELFELDYGRMNATLGTELRFTSFNNQTTIPFGYVDPTTEIITDSASVIGQPVGVAGDGSEIWKIVHNGVDSHAIHFHLFNVQVINRVGWDGSVRTPDSNELGWKDTVRMNPLEVIYVALRPTSQTLPWPIPDSIRKLDVTMPEGPDPAMSPVGPDGNPVPQTNVLSNFGWEYVWHCHILGHEENDMMRAIRFQVPPPMPANLFATIDPQLNVNLTWTDMSMSASQPGGGFNVQSASDPAFTTNVRTWTGPTSTGFGATVTSQDPTPTGLFWYRVQAFSANGISAWTGGVQPGQLVTATTMTTNSPIIYGQNGVVTVTVTATGGVVAGNVSLTVDNGTPITQVLAGNPGSSVFTLTGLKAGLHNLVANYAGVPAGCIQPNCFITGSSANGSITVNPAPLTIQASSAAVTYGSPIPTITPIVTGLVNGDTVASLGTITCTTTYTPTGSVSGSPYSTSCTGGTANPNYQTPTYLSGAVTVNPALLVVTASNGAMTYGGTVPTITASITGFVNGETIAVLTTQPICSTTATSTSNVGSYPSTCTGAAAANYTFTYQPGTVTISQATSTTTITGQSPNPSVVNQQVTVSFKVAPQFTGTPTGNVKVTASTGESCTGTLNGGGTGSCTLTFATTGTRTMTGAYGGDTNFKASTSSPSPSQNVIDFVIGVSPASQTVNGNQRASYTLTLTAIGGVAMPVNLSCSTSQPAFTCTVSPTQVTPNGGTKTATLTVNTTKNSPGTWTVTGTGNYSSAAGTLTHKVNASLTVRR
jgi:FtsP/CotA-like multicopper oxidase with cupredoxin domain